jgi:hypothetical protein
VLREGVAVTGIGLALGLAGGLLAARSLGTVLYGVPPTDPVAASAAALVMAATALAACNVPARRARLDPARTLAVE